MTQREKEYRQHLEEAEIKMNKMLMEMDEGERNIGVLNS